MGRVEAKEDFDPERRIGLEGRRLMEKIHVNLTDGNEDFDVMMLTLNVEH